MKIKSQYKWYSLVAATLIIVVLICLWEYHHHYYNNYLIFTRPLRVLLSAGNIYDFHPEYYMDTYKYSPTFAIIIGVLSYLPDLTGIIVWNLLNAGTLILGIYFFFPDPTHRLYSLLLLLPMFAIAVHNEQSNSLMAGCMLLCVYFLRKEKPLPAAVFVTICLFIKFYAFLLIVVFIFFNKKREFILYTLACVLIAAFFPLVILNFDYLMHLYKLWWHVLQTTELTMQCSIMGIADNWFGIEIHHTVWGIAGLIILLLPLSNTKMYKDFYFQQLMISSIFIFMVLFNKMAGFPTYIIAVTGSCIWFFASENKNLFSKSIVLCIFVLGICSQYVLPFSLVDKWIIPTNIWAFPFLILWIYIQITLWKIEFDHTPSTLNI